MPKMKIAGVPKPDANFELQEREIPGNQAYARMMSGKAQFRIVLTM